jgi:hypothetical protein
MLVQRCRTSSLALALTALALAPDFAGAQSPTPGAVPQQAAPPAANPADVESIDAIIAALYGVISGDAGVKRDWDRFRSLFIPDARLIPTSVRSDGSRGHRVLTAEEYATQMGPQLERGGFHERELGRHVDRYGNIVQVFSSYDSKRTLADPAPFARGINSIQLWNDGKRWWVVSIFWEGERPENPIPAEFLKKPTEEQG